MMRGRMFGGGKFLRDRKYRTADEEKRDERITKMHTMILWHDGSVSN